MSDPEQAEIAQLLEFALRRRLYVRAHYNRGVSRLAPQALIDKNGPFLRAVTVERDGRIPKWPKLGTFRLSGLTDVRLENAEFDPAAVFAPFQAELASPPR